MSKLLRVRLAQTFIFIALLAQPLSAVPSPDFDDSGVVDFTDFLLFVSAFGSREGQEGYDTKYDLNGDGVIAFADFLLFASDFGRTVEFLRTATTYQQFVKAKENVEQNPSYPISPTRAITTSPNPYPMSHIPYSTSQIMEPSPMIPCLIKAPSKQPLPQQRPMAEVLSSFHRVNFSSPLMPIQTLLVITRLSEFVAVISS